METIITTVYSVLFLTKTEIQMITEARKSVKKKKGLFSVFR